MDGQRVGLTPKTGLLDLPRRSFDNAVGAHGAFNDKIAAQAQAFGFQVLD